jgi:hypothetical protein
MNHKNWYCDNDLEIKTRIVKRTDQIEETIKVDE